MTDSDRKRMNLVIALTEDSDEATVYEDYEQAFDLMQAFDSLASAGMLASLGIDLSGSNGFRKDYRSEVAFLHYGGANEDTSMYGVVVARLTKDPLTMHADSVYVRMEPMWKQS